MKKLRIAVLLVTVISLLGLILACDTGGGSSGPSASVPLPAPSANDYNIGGTGTFDFVAGTDRAVTITPKTDAPAVAAIWYTKEGSSPTNTAPSATGVYAVTFDVGAVSGKWAAVTGLYAGQVNITDGDKKTPASDHYTATGVGVTIKVGDPAPTVIISRKQGVDSSSGTISAPRYKKVGENNTSASLPTGSAGTYEVLFDVAPAAGWNAGTDLFAGHIFVSTTGLPVTALKFEDFDFNIGTEKFLSETAAVSVKYNGKAQGVTVTPITGNSYPLPTTPGLANYTYSKADNTPLPLGAPTDVGSYKVKIEFQGLVITDANGAAIGAWSGNDFTLSYTIGAKTPDVNDYIIGNLNQSEAGNLLQGAAYAVKHVTITKRTSSTTPVGISPTNSAITIYYERIEGADTSWDNTKGFSESDVTTWNTDGGQISANASKAPPQKAGKYKVTFKVAKSNPADDNWIDSDTTVEAGTLTLGALEPVYPEFVRFWVDKDEDMLKVSTSQFIAVFPGDKVTFTKTGGAGTVKEWWVDGKLVPDNAELSYDFTATALGWHSVSLIVWNDGKAYSQTVPLQVQARP